MEPPRDYLEQKLLTGAGIMLSLFGGTLLLMAAVASVLALMAPFMGEGKAGLRTFAAVIPMALAAAGCLYYGLWLRRLPVTIKSMARSAGEAVALQISALWTIRVSSAAVPAWETIAYLLVLGLFFYWGLNRFRESRPDGLLARK